MSSYCFGAKNRKEKTTMLKTITLSILAVMMFAGLAQSQSLSSGTGRIEALANSPFIMDAATDINNNPAWNNYYQDYIFGDIGRNAVSQTELTGQYAGITFGVGKQWNLGLVLNKTEGLWDVFNSDTLAPYRPAALGIDAPIVPTKLLIGYKSSNNLYLGLAPYFARYSGQLTIGNDITKWSSSSFGVQLGVLSQMNSGWIEGVAKIGMNGYKREITGTTNSTVENSGGTEIGVGLRGWFIANKNRNIAVVPVANFNTYSWNPTFIGTAANSTAKYSFTNFGVGVGVNVPVSNDIQIAAGLLMSYNSAKKDSTNYSNEFSDLSFPRFNVAAEWNLTDWLTGRMGYNRGVENITSKGTAGTTTAEVKETIASNSSQVISLGLGFHFDRFSLDGTVGQRLLKQGFNVITGSTGNDLFGVLSASYVFGN